MIRWAGVIFIVASASSMGIRVALSLRRRCALLRQLMTALQLMKNEISFCGTPLPQTFALMAAACDGPLEQLFSQIAKDMDKRRWLTPLAAMQQALKNVPELPQGDRIALILLELSGKLGKYDLDSQRQGIDLALAQLEEERQKAEREQSLKGRTYETLGVCAGLAAAILLL